MSKRAANSKEGIIHLFENMLAGFEEKRYPLVPEERRTCVHPVTEHDEAILSEISNHAYEQSEDAREEQKRCQELLDERWPELKCNYDEAVAWLHRELGH